ncbi:MAG: FixH family protein [Verrucomicrobiota bacterium]|nr:FixH family protein [Verrucomicrobiota bacterium]
MPSATQNPTVRPPRSLWPVSIVIFFIFVVIGLGSLVALCTMHKEELVRPDYYEQELRHQGRMDQIGRAGALSTRLSIAYDPESRAIQLEFPSAAFGQTTTGQVELYRPSSVSMDRMFKINPNLGRTQVIDASRISSGLWRVRVSWVTEGQTFMVEEKLVIPAMVK